jgi:hypothetical protein
MARSTAKTRAELEPTYPTSQLLERFHCDRKTLRRHAKKLRLAVMKPGRERVYTESQVAALEALFVTRSGPIDMLAPEAEAPARKAVDALRAARSRQTKRRFGPLRLAPRGTASRPAGNVVALRLEKAD